MSGHLEPPRSIRFGTGWYDTLPVGKHQLAKHLPSEEAQDVAKQGRLWELSERLVAAV